MDKVKMAIVGAGTWGGTHAAIYAQHPYAEPVCICDMNKERAEQYAAEHNLKEVYTDYNDMLKHCDCDAVAIVTPDFAHADIAIAAANAGKHMLIEKPLATTRDDVMRMYDAITKNNVRAMVDFHNRWNPVYNTMQQLIASGKYGAPRSGHFRMTDNLWVATDMIKWCAKSSILWFLGSHSLDTLNFLFDDYPTEVFAYKTEGVLKKLGIDTVDSYMSMFKYSKGGMAQMENSWVTPNGNPNVNDFKCYILCEDGKFDANCSSYDMLQVTDQTRMISQDVTVKHSVFGEWKGFAYESIRSFVDCLISGDEFHVTLEESANISLALLAVMESADTGKIVQIERI